MAAGSAASSPAPSWQTDPFGRHEQRYWDGQRWTEKVRSSGTVGIDPPGIVPKPEHARNHVPAEPITDAARPVSYRPQNMAWVLALGLVLLVIIVILAIVGIMSA